MSSIWTTAGAWVECLAFAAIAAVIGALVLVGIPGIWAVVLLASLIDALHLLLAPSGEPFFGLWALVGAAGMACAAEVVEFFAGAAGARAGGSSSRGMIGAVIGSIIGALAGTCAIPVPVLGTLIGAIGGAAAGAMIGELTTGRRSVRDSVAPAVGAAAGRLAGFLLKLPFAAAAWLILVVSAAWRLL